MVVGGEDGVTVRDAATLSVLKRFPHGRHGRDPHPADRVRAERRRPHGGDRRRGRLAATPRPVAAAGCGPPPAGIARAVNEARFTPDGRTLVTTGEDGDVILWDVRQAAAAETLSGHSRSAFSPQIADDGKTLYTASLDGTVLIWDLAGDRRLGRRFTPGPATAPATP